MGASSGNSADWEKPSDFIDLRPIGDRNKKPPGNGILLWFEVDDIDAAVAQAEEIKAEVIMPRHRNPPDSDNGPNHWEIWLRDPDGYKVVLASPDGTADGNVATLTLPESIVLYNPAPWLSLRLVSPSDVLPGAYLTTTNRRSARLFWF